MNQQTNYDKAIRKADLGMPETAKAYAILALVDVLRSQGKPTPVPVPEGVLKGVQR